MLPLALIVALPTPCGRAPGRIARDTPGENGLAIPGRIAKDGEPVLTIPSGGEASLMILSCTTPSGGEARRMILSCTPPGAPGRRRGEKPPAGGGGATIRSWIRSGGAAIAFQHEAGRQGLARFRQETFLTMGDTCTTRTDR